MNKSFVNRLTVAALLLTLFAGALTADDFEFSAGRVRSVFAEGREQTVLENGARVENDQILITADRISLSGEGNRYIESSGTVFLRDKEQDVELRAEFLNYDSREDYLVLEGSAEFLDEGQDILVKATFIERQEGVAVFQIDVQILREDLIARAEYVRFFEEGGKLELSGFPVVNYRGDEYSADIISIYTDSDEIILEGEVQGRISEEDDGVSMEERTEGDGTGGDGSRPPQAPPETGGVQ
jgi:lipopolysaccharide export system protein LptA